MKGRNSLNIGIFAHIEYGSPGGIQQYIERLTKALVTYSNEKIYVITNREFYNNFFYSLENTNNFICVICNKDEYEIKEKINSIPLDVLHFPFQSFPYYYWNLPTLISLHDLQQEYFPEFFSDEELKFRDYHYKKSSIMCDQIIVSFNHVKNDIIRFYNINKNKISVVTPGIDKFYDNTKIDVNINEQFGINKDFILYPAQTWKHKNHIKLIDAVKILLHKYNQDICLVCTGKKNKYYEEIEKYIKINHMEDNVKFLDFVSIKNLYSLYKNTKLVVIPTLYEAGSFPLYESISLDVPVICSNVTSLPETINNTKFVFNPNDDEEIALLINKMLTDNSLIDENIENSRIQIRKLDWKRSIENLIYGYKCAITNFETYNANRDIFKNRYNYEVEHKNYLNSVNQLIDNLPDNKNIVIYGAGEHTRHLLMETNIKSKKVNFIVDKGHNNFNFMGYDVREVEYLKKSNPDIIIISSYSYQNSIEKSLLQELNYKGQIVKLYNNEKYPFYL